MSIRDPRVAGVAMIVVASVMSGCARPAGHDMRPEEVMDFGTLYETNCAGCHGAGGRHGVAQPLNDPLYLALISDARLRDVISRGVRGTPMTPFGKDAGGTLTREQIDALVREMRRQWAGPERFSDAALPPYSADDAIARGSAAGDPGRGATAFRIYCARCHGEEGQGGSAGSVVDRAFLSLTSDQALRTTTIAGRADEGTPGWREYVPGRPMNNQEISDVVAWLAAHRGQHE